VGYNQGEAPVTMQFSQIVLIATIVGFVIYSFRLRSVLVDRILYALITVVGIVFVIAPNLSTRIANMIGIGRGADLVVYAFIMFSLFQLVSTSAALREMDRKMTVLVRENAIRHPVGGKLTTEQRSR
jgi:small membrane protein